jgi:hypothetical protein
MPNNNFKGGPGGRLVKAQADATKVEKQFPIIVNPAFPPGVMLEPVEVVAPSNKTYYPKPYFPEQDTIQMNLKGFVNNLKQINKDLGGNIWKGGNKNETYSDVISRLEQTPGTLQYKLKNTFPNVNRIAAATGDVVLDPLNRVPFGRMAKYGLHGVANFVKTLPMGAKAAQKLMMFGNAAPYIDLAGDAAEAVDLHIDYPNKPRINFETMTPQQKEFLQKLSEYNFGIVK